MGGVGTGSRVGLFGRRVPVLEVGGGGGETHRGCGD